ncbi:MAG: ABC transporter permease [Methanomassiliicoccaceae archaeon]|nr:ABC transporter permease [Methanomassiliicoccaceae archaeon]
MSHLWNLIRKELKELMTPASVISIIVVAAVFASMGTMISSEADRVMEPPTIGILNMSDDNENIACAIGYIDDFYIRTYGVPSGNYLIHMNVVPEDRYAIIAWMQERNITVLFAFDADYSDNISQIADGTGSRGLITVYYSEVSTGVFGTVSTSIINMMISHINMRTSEAIIGDLIGNGGDGASNIRSPIQVSNNTVFGGTMHEGLTPSDISSALQTQSFLMPILIMIIITMIGGMIISSMGNEKENKTLETLLTMPVARTTIVTGKLLGSTIAGLAFGLAYLVGMYFYMDSMNVGNMSTDNIGLTLALTDWGIIAMMIFLAILCALGMCMILGAFVKNYKAAQTLTLPITVLAMVPMFVIMFADFNTLPGVLQGILFAIPFTHPMMVMNNLMLGNTFLIWTGLGYLMIFSLLTIYLTVRIYNSDILLTGLIRKKRSPPKSLFGRSRDRTK